MHISAQGGKLRSCDPAYQREQPVNNISEGDQIMQMTERPRRLRSTPALRKMVRETRVDASSLIYPMFVTDGSGRTEEIEAMPGQYRYTVDMTDGKIESLLNAGVSSIMLFGIPEHKDELGTQAYAEDGIIQRAVSHIKERYPEMFQIIRYSARGENIFKCLCVDEEMVYSKRYALWNKCEIPSLPEEKRPRLIEQYEEIPEDEFKNTLKKTISRMKA